MERGVRFKGGSRLVSHLQVGWLVSCIGAECDIGDVACLLAGGQRLAAINLKEVVSAPVTVRAVTATWHGATAHQKPPTAPPSCAPHRLPPARPAPRPQEALRSGTSTACAQTTAVAWVTCCAPAATVPCPLSDPPTSCRSPRRGWSRAARSAAEAAVASVHRAGCAAHPLPRFEASHYRRASAGRCPAPTRRPPAESACDELRSPTGYAARQRHQPARWRS